MDPGGLYSCLPAPLKGGLRRREPDSLEPLPGQPCPQVRGQRGTGELTEDREGRGEEPTEVQDTQWCSQNIYQNRLRTKPESKSRTFPKTKVMAF